MDRTRGVRYGQGAAAGMNYSGQVMDAGSFNVMTDAIEEAGPYNGSPFENYTETVYYKTKHSIVQYYQDVYGDRKGKGGWKDRLAKDYVAFTGEKITAVKRSLDPGRMHQPGNKQQWAAFGKTLPPVVVERQRPRKRKRARVDFSIYFRISNSYKQVSRSVTLSDDETARLMEQGDFDAVLEAYALNNIDMLEDLDIGAMTVTLID